MTEQEFLNIKQESDRYKYSSMKYLDFDSVESYEVVAQTDDVILLYGYNGESKMNEYHWASNTAEALISSIETGRDNVLLTFIPEDWVVELEKMGFQIFAKWNDYFMEDISCITDGVKSRFLDKADCQRASAVTLSCKGQSRGFTGQTAAWMSIWLKGNEDSKIDEGKKNNAIIVHKNNEGEIVGVVCVATYAHQSDKGPIVWIREVAVIPEYQRQGIARSLILQALSYGKRHGATRAFLAADECNKHAIHLYESIGFVGDRDEVQIDMCLLKMESN
ncbi:MAG: GNAT family N-acetyltransferase [Cellulosilyticaceae bacterium]